MDINSITSQSAMLEVSRLSASSANDDLPTSSSSASIISSNRTTPQAQMLSVRSNIDYIQQQLDALLEDYPPWFPAGSPQRIDTIKAMKCVVDSVKNLSVPDDVKKQLSGIQLTDNASDSDISEAWDAITQFKNKVVDNGTPVSGNGQPGNIVSIKA